MTTATEIRDAIIAEIRRQFDVSGYYISDRDKPEYLTVDGAVDFDKVAEVVIKLVEAGDLRCPACKSED